MPKFSDISQFTRSPSYRVNVDWRYLDQTLENWSERFVHLGNECGGLDLEPDFQRAHVWTALQQTRYVEFILKGGQSSREILFNCKGWMGAFEGKIVIVDGKQRLEAARRFLANEVPAFGYFLKDFTDRLRADFVFSVNTLQTRKEVLQWYLELNTGGTPHTADEIQRVRELFENEN